MNREWEERFNTWAQPPSETAQLKAERAERVVRLAVSASTRLARHGVSVFPQGSYRNRTNVRHDSDVDICVLTDQMCFFDLRNGKSPADFGITVPGPYPYATFKDDVGTALRDYLGWD